jgi:hypothetical protein
MSICIEHIVKLVIACFRVYLHLLIMDLGSFKILLDSVKIVAIKLTFVMGVKFICDFDFGPRILFFIGSLIEELRCLCS